MKLNERWQYWFQEWKKKLKRRHEHGWKGVSVLVFSADAGLPYRIRINYYALTFSIALLIVVPGFALFNEIKRATIDRNRYEKMQTSEILLSNHHIVLMQKTDLLHHLELQRNRLYRLGWGQKFDSESKEHLRFESVEEKVISTGSRFDLDLERYKQYAANADLLFSYTGQVVLKPLWHKAAIYWMMPKGWPVLPGTASISSGYGSRMDPFLKTVPGTFHGGIDFAAAPNTPIIATAPGMVIRSVDTASRSGFGRHVLIHHALGYQTLYAHCNKVLVKAGERVQKGQVIALVGRTGMATGNHIHYEVRFGLEQPSNPAPYISFR